MTDNTIPDRITCDFLVIGTGIAGLTFALKAADHGEVVMVTKKNDTESNTNYAQGGIAAVMGSDDSFELHEEDTMRAGVYLCNREAVRILVREGPDRVRELMEMGVRFTQEMIDEEHARIALGREGGHSRRRIVHAADLTGREVERALVHQAKKRASIRILENNMAIGLILRPSERPDRPVCLGAHIFDTRAARTRTVLSRVTVLSTGGLGRTYLHTTNPDIATGDGVALSYQAGARIANMEFIQFHPTALFHSQGESFLISEAVRGEGGVLRLKDGSTFMEKYHEMGCLAPRDIVARAIDAELKASGEECVWLDVTHLGEERIRERFPNIHEKCLSLGIDIAREWIPVVPAAHYACGGVMTDDRGRTDIERLYATGEVSCTGVHGANRLASNSLLEALVFSHRAAEDSAAVVREIPLETGAPDFPEEEHCEPVPLELVKELMLRLRTVMWVYVGIVRTTERLREALREVSIIAAKAEELYRRGRLSRELLELRSMVTAAELIVRCALMRKESRGLHYILDYPHRDDEHWLKDTVLRKESP